MEGSAGYPMGPLVPPVRPIRPYGPDWNSMGPRVWLAGWLEGWLAIATQQVSQSTQLGRHRFPGRQAGLASQRADSPQGLTQGVGWRHGEPIGRVATPALRVATSRGCLTLLCWCFVCEGQYLLGHDSRCNVSPPNSTIVAAFRVCVFYHPELFKLLCMKDVFCATSSLPTRWRRHPG